MLVMLACWLLPLLCCFIAPSRFTHRPVWKTAVDEEARTVSLARSYTRISKVGICWRLAVIINITYGNISQMLLWFPDQNRWNIDWNLLILQNIHFYSFISEINCLETFVTVLKEQMNSVGPVQMICCTS